MRFLRICLSLLLFFGYIDNELLCFKGFRLHTPISGSDVCLPCKDGVNFISDYQHSKRQCHACTQITNPDLEILVSECNRTHDTEILCKSGYYRIKARNSRDKDECVKCRECASPTRECQGYHDTMCCPPNYDAVLSGDDYLCKVRPVVCGPGHYFKEISDECLPCPDGTYMNDNVHTYTQCLKCGVLSGELTHAVIIRSCNKTSPTLFGCEPGYFRDPGKESLQIETTCSHCQKCDQQIRECDMFYDTICGLQDFPALVSDTVARKHPDIEDSMDTLETGKTENIQIKMHTTKVKSAEDKPDENASNIINNDYQIMNHNNIEFSLKNQEKGIHRGNKDGIENLVLSRKICLVLITLVAAVLEGYIVYSFYCISVLSRSYNNRYMKFPFSLYRNVENSRWRMSYSVMYQQIICAPLVYSGIMYFGDSSAALVLILLILATISFCNTKILLKFLRFLAIIEKHSGTASERQTLIEHKEVEID